MSEPYEDWGIYFENDKKTAIVLFSYFEDNGFYRQIQPMPNGIGCRNRQVVRDLARVLKRDFPSISWKYNVSPH